MSFQVFTFGDIATRNDIVQFRSENTHSFGRFGFLALEDAGNLVLCYRTAMVALFPANEDTISFAQELLSIFMHES